MHIGFIGLGQMGAPIAANILKAGFDLTVWNRSADKAAPLVAAGAALAESPRTLAAGCDIVLSDSRVPMPLLSLLRDHLIETIAKESEDIDWSGIGLTVAKNAGL
jgi:3-hydroxyisobutyrate dehydrogenase-like beta-hydroxyacid dehydrogenase